MSKVAKRLADDAKELKDETLDKNLSREIIKSDKAIERFAGRWNAGFVERRQVQPMAPHRDYDLTPEQEVARQKWYADQATKIVVSPGRGDSDQARPARAGKGAEAGLVSRSGYRRIIPGWLTEDSQLWDGRAEELATAAKLLRGRNAEIFEKLILGPLNGARAPSISELAEEYGVPPARIYRIRDDCKNKIMAALKRGAVAEPAVINRDWDSLIREMKEMWRQVVEDEFNASVLFHRVRLRSALVDELLAEAPQIPRQMRVGYTAELNGRSRQRYRLDPICSTVVLRGYLDRVKELIAGANDPALADPNALRVVGEALRERLPACRSTCSCGGYGPRLPWDD